MKILSSSLVVVGPVRLSYMKLFAPKANRLKKVVEYSAVLLFPKSPDGVLMKEEFETFLTNFGAEKLGKRKVKNLILPLRDGDSPEEADDNGELKHSGYWFMNVSADETHPPALVDNNGEQARAVDWASGDWGKVKLKLYAYDEAGKRGVACGLGAVCFTHHDERFGEQINNVEGFDFED